MPVTGQPVAVPTSPMDQPAACRRARESSGWGKVDMGVIVRHRRIGQQSPRIDQARFPASAGSEGSPRRLGTRQGRGGIWERGKVSMQSGTGPEPMARKKAGNPGIGVSLPDGERGRKSVAFLRRG